MPMLSSVLLWGTVVGIIHFVVVGLLYGNPVVGRLYQTAMEDEPGVKRWDSQPRYLVAMFLGTQVEVYILAIAFLWLRPLVPTPGIAGALLLGAVLTGVRVYPRFWNMWIQSTYPNRLLAIEVVNGVIGTLIIVVGLQLLAFRG